MEALQEKVKTLGDLKESGWQSQSIRDEIRKNLMQKISNSEPLFEGIRGYDKTVIPQLQHALLAKHDFILLGLRGQGKSRILRMLPEFLDEYLPIVSGSEINDDPYHPLSKYAIDLLAGKGDSTPIEWIHRSRRYGEKLATPDTTVSDLIGDVDPIKAASKRLTLGDENVINFGLIPRTNRGIFVINELPDLQPRIQVALLNIMQERDIQIRGFNVRIPLDNVMAFSANPEDYTNRGNLITPLKDRIDSQIMTHYPKELETGMQITNQEAWTVRHDDRTIHMPKMFEELVEYVAYEARQSEYIDQKSGVSTRLPITAIEQIISATERRMMLNNEKETTVRVADLYHMVPALTGKLELVYEGEQEGAVNVAHHLIGKAVNNIFKKSFPDPQQKKSEDDHEYGPIVNWFAKGNQLDLPDKLSEKEYRKTLSQIDGLEDIAAKYGKPQNEQEKYVLMDLILEALHQNSMLGKEDVDEQRSYTDMLGSMLGSLDDLDDLDDQDIDDIDDLDDNLE